MEVDHIDKRERVTPIKILDEASQEYWIFSLEEEDAIEAVVAQQSVSETDAFEML